MYFSHPDLHDENNLSAQFTSMKGQFTISANMLVSVFVMYGIGYFVGRSFTDNESTVNICSVILYPSTVYIGLNPDHLESFDLMSACVLFRE